MAFMVISVILRHLLRCRRECVVA